MWGLVIFGEQMGFLVEGEMGFLVEEEMDFLGGGNFPGRR